MPLTNNDIFRRLRYALDLHDPDLIEIFTLVGAPLERAVIIGLLKKEGDPECVECSDQTLISFLDGLIIKRRGKKEESDAQVKPVHLPLSNNLVLKKIRIALELQEGDLIAIMSKAGIEISRHELSALFRNRDNKNYKECGDQFLRNFLSGLKDYPLQHHT
jgi:uncharacterized protein YehS (DUF1456 family)